MPPAKRAAIKARLELPFEQRQRSRLRTQLASGEAVALLLPRGEILRGGDVLQADDGRLVLVVAANETLLHVECAHPHDLARAAYHLGNRHVAVQVGDGFLRLAADHVLEDMLRGLGAKLTPITAPFEPEGGAYHGHQGEGHDHAHHHHHAHGEDERPGRIHEYGIDDAKGKKA